MKTSKNLVSALLNDQWQSGVEASFSYFFRFRCDEVEERLRNPRLGIFSNSGYALTTMATTQ
jgi:hypothetical protein